MNAARSWLCSSLLLGALALAPTLGCAAAPDSEEFDDEGEEEDDGKARDGGAKRDSGTRPSTSRDGGTTTTTPPRTGDGGALPNPLTPGDRTPNKDNIKECPPVAPENPVGSCIGVPIYATCGYTTYNCICDWYHWICI